MCYFFTEYTVCVGDWVVLVFVLVLGVVLVFVFYNLAAQPGVKFSGLNLARLYIHRGQQTQIQNQILEKR